jgi:hypothetical protein
VKEGSVKYVQQIVGYLRQHNFVRLIVELLFLAGIYAIVSQGNRSIDFKTLSEVTNDVINQ